MIKWVSENLFFCYFFVLLMTPKYRKFVHLISFIGFVDEYKSSSKKTKNSKQKVSLSIEVLCCFFFLQTYDEYLRTYFFVVFLFFWWLLSIDKNIDVWNSQLISEHKKKVGSKASNGPPSLNVCDLIIFYSKYW